MEEIITAIKLLVKNQDEFLKNLTVAQSHSIGTHQNVPPFHAFDKGKESWATYQQQLQQHFTAYGITCDDKKRAYFLSWLGAETYELLEKIYGSAKLSDQKFSDLVEKLSEHFKANVHICTTRYDFFKCRAKPGQTYAEWIADLRGLARECQFVCSSTKCKQEYTDEMIRDVLILHTPHDAVRTAALQKPNPTLKEVISIAEAYEATQKSMQVLRNKSLDQALDVNQVRAFFSNTKPSNHRIREKRSRSLGRHCRINASTPQSCSGCGTHHRQVQCKFLNAICRNCNERGHIAPVCPNIYSRNSSGRKTHFRSGHTKPSVKHEYVNSVIEECIVPFDNSVREFKNKFVVSVTVNSQEMDFLLDTGASVSVIGLPGYNQLNRPKVYKPTRKLKSYGSANVPILGEIIVEVKFKGITQNLRLLVTNTQSGDNIFGMDWANVFGLSISFDTKAHVQLLKSTPVVDVKSICDKYSNLFLSSLGRCASVKAKLHLKQSATPKFFKSRPIPFAHIEAFKKEAKRLEEAGIWKAVRFSEWAAPIVIVKKRNGQIRVCGDFKVTVNRQLEVDHYPIPRPEELFHKLAGGQHFSKIDLADAYLQIELDDESKKLVTVNTPLGLYEYQRLPFGIASAPAIYQRTLEMILSGLPCAIYMDDIIVTGRNHQEHLQNLEAVFQRLSDNGLRVNGSKCSFMQQKVEYLGHILSASGVSPSETGLQAIKNLPRPANLKELQAFLGKVNYYSKFIRNFSQTAAPLNALRKKNVPFQWKLAQEQSFQNLKQQILKATRLTHFRPELPLILATDASSHGIGAVISHLLPDGSEQPIAYASKTLNDHQKNYSQIEKEAFAIIYGVTKFRQYLYGRHFTLTTDHKPLLTIFHPDKKLPLMTTSRLTRWALTLMSYKYTIKFKPTAKHANADALSRLPLGPDAEFDASEESCHEVILQIEEDLKSFPVKVQEIVQETRRDDTLRKVIRYLREGWPDKLPKEENHLLPYFCRRMSLSMHKGVILFETEHTRVIIPKKLRDRILRMLHEGHWGVVRSKQLARRYCWWPRIDANIEDMSKQCNICQTSASSPPREFSSWPQPQKPWERVHLDFAGPFLGQMWLVCVDALSKFPFVVPMSKITSTATIRALTKIFALEGLPETIVSDNGTQFCAKEFHAFCSKYGIQHLRTSPFHPASNGEAERFVRTFKTSLKKVHEEEEDIDAALAECLMTYRTMPNPVTGKSPSEILHGRQHRTLLSQVSPIDNKNYTASSASKFHVGQRVYARNYSRGPLWIKGSVLSVKGSRMFVIRTDNNMNWTRHQNQLRSCRESSTDDDTFLLASHLAQTPKGTIKDNRHQQISHISNDVNTPPEKTVSPILKTTSPVHEKTVLRQSTRIRKPVVRFTCS